jgi:hypothetical protein
MSARKQNSPRKATPGTPVRQPQALAQVAEILEQQPTYSIPLQASALGKGGPKEKEMLEAITHADEGSPRQTH